MDSVELGISQECELKTCSNSVGAYGKVDEKGQSSLDAMMMDGKSLRVGAVGNVKTVKNVISLARSVIKYTRSTFIVGDDVTDFAAEMGFNMSNLTNHRTDRLYNRWRFNRTCQPNFRQNVHPDPRQNCGPYRPLPVDDDTPAAQEVPELPDDLIMHGLSGKIYSPVEDPDHDTICMLGIDEQRHLVTGVSTNGLSYKIPGRVGDSPIAGAGGYADNEAGAAAATGNGDIMLRFLPSYQAVESMRHGLSAKQAADYAIWRIARKEPIFRGAIITLSKDGEYAAACYGYGIPNTTFHGVFSFGVRTADMTEAELDVVECIDLANYTSPYPPQGPPPAACPTQTSSSFILHNHPGLLFILGVVSVFGRNVI